jgi:diguanylate cyclase (GGDEF)-like protein/PAS domain S-box-containing protein
MSMPAQADLRHFVADSAVQIAMFDRDMRYVAASRSWKGAYRLPENCEGLSHYDLFPNVPKRWKDAYRRGLSGETVSHADDEFTFAPGAVCWVDWSVSPWRDAEGDIGGVVILAIDVKQRKNIEKVARESEDRLARLFTNLPVAYQSLDVAGYWLDANQKMAELLGFDHPAQLLGLNFTDFWTDDIRRLPETPFARFKRTDVVDGEQTLVKRDGSTVKIIISGRIERDVSGQFLRTHCILIDITERHRMEQHIRELNADLEYKVAERTAELTEANRELIHLARFDILTDLPNRLEADRRLNKAFVRMKRSGQAYALLMIDIDYFKQVNDSFGHSVGDKTLQRVAQVLRGNLRGSDFVCRYGGEEFLAILPNATLKEASHVAGKLRQAVAACADPLVAAAAPGDADCDVAVTHADNELYKAKKSGRNQVSASFSSPSPERFIMDDGVRPNMALK